MPVRDDCGEIIGTFRISRDVMAQIEAEEALTQQARQLGLQNERLRELDGLKDEFLGLVSHGLRTPLTSIIGYARLLRDERTSNLNTDQFTEVIQRNAQRLLHLVEDLLFLSQNQPGELAVELRGADLADIAASVVEEMRPEAERKHIELAFSAAAVPRFAVDAGRLAHSRSAFRDRRARHDRDSETTQTNWSVTLQGTFRISPEDSQANRR